MQGLGAGADDFVTKGADIEIVVARLRALLRMKAYQDQLRRMNQQMTRDLQIARRVQEALVPQGVYTTPRIEIRSAYIPSEVLSGDFYDYFMQDESAVSLRGRCVRPRTSCRDPRVAAEELHSQRGCDRTRSLAEFMIAPQQLPLQA